MKALLYILFVLCPVSMLAADEKAPFDTPCDTIKLIDGRIIVGRIYYEDRTVVKFNNCNDAIKTKDQVSMYQVKEIAYGSDKHNQPFVEDRSRLNRRGVYLIVSLGLALLATLVIVLLLI